MGPGGEPFNGHPGDGDFFPMQGEIRAGGVTYMCYNLMFQDQEWDQE